MARSDDRILTFFVSGALLAGAAACSKETEPEEPRTNVAKEEHVNEGPTKEPEANSDAGTTAEPHTNTGPATVPHTNTGPKESAQPRPRTNVGREAEEPK